MGDTLRRLPAAALLALVALASGAEAASPGDFKVIVHSSTAGSRIPRAVVAAVFLRQVESWGNGVSIQVRDRSLTSPERVAFGSQVLGMTTLEMNQFWVRQMSRGKTPPEVAQTDDEAISFVASHPGAISYVAADTVTPPEVKVVQID